MATAPVQTPAPLTGIAADPRAARALDWLAKNLDWVGDEQVRITEIPAPSFRESARGVYLRKLLASAGLRVQTDSVGNVIGFWPGGSASEVVMLVAHLDTVFPAATDVHVRREAGRLYAPGIS